jgi:hypothetical protein
MSNPRLERTLARVLNGERPPATEGFFTTDTVEIVNLYKRRDDPSATWPPSRWRSSAAIMILPYTPDTAFEDRAGAWARVTYRTCLKCSVVNERLDASARGPLGDWQRTAKFKVTA